VNLFEVLNLDPLRKTHKIAGNDARAQRNDGALSGSGHLSEMGRDRVVEGLVNGQGKGNLGIGWER
jgi:hypothetical protein